MILFNAITILAAALALNLVPEINAHGYLKSPRSRNYYAQTNGKWWGGGASDPRPENCPHCLNIGGTEARCGLFEDRNYDRPANSLGGVMPPVIQACYQPGSIVSFETVLSAYHKGHFEFFACPIANGQIPTQACFDANPLKFVSDELYGATPDPNYPVRAYIPNKDIYPGGLIKDGDFYLFRHKYQLPATVTGELVLIQWHYVTGNSCKDKGYDRYNWPVGFYPGDIPVCSQPLPPSGRGVPEQFWNCAEVKISNSCAGPAPVPGPTPTTPTAPVPGPTPTTPTTPGNCAAASNVCGPNKPCSGGLCCSQWGYCGTTDAYCGTCCQSNCWNQPNPTPVTAKPTSLPPPTTLKGDWELCSSSTECKNGCCSGTYSGGTLKCTPLTGGYRSDLCVGGSPALKGDWELCSRSGECKNGCCSGTYSGGTLKCTPLNGGYRTDVCVAP